jgi:hypothetical protein
MLSSDHPNGRPESRTQPTRTANGRLPTTLPISSLQAETTTEAAVVGPNDNDILQVRYLIRMPESDAAIQSRSQPDEYGEIVSHGPMELGVWQPVIDTSEPREYHLWASEDSKASSEDAHVENNCKP